MNHVLMPRAILGELSKEASSWSNKIERGGLLLGYRKGDAIEISDVTFPGFWDRASPILFQRSERSHRKHALRAWIKSGKTVDWVGEWHTHPSGGVEPSFIDINNWDRIVKHTNRNMAFLILGNQKLYCALSGPGSGVKVLDVVEEESSFILFG